MRTSLRNIRSTIIDCWQFCSSTIGKKALIKGSQIKAMRKPLQLSFIFHIAIVLVLFTLNSSPIGTQNILVVDFTMEDKPCIRQGSNSATVTIPADSKKNPKGIRKKEPMLNQQNEAPVTVTPKAIDIRDLSKSNPQAPIMAISPSSIDSPLSLSDSAGNGTQGIMHEANSQQGLQSGASSSGEGDIGSSEGSGYVKAHFAYIKDLIHKHLIYPTLAKRMGWQGKVIVSFVISSGGNAKDIILAKSSGHEILDDNVLKAVRIASPYPKPPVEAQIIVPVLYRLN